MSVWLPALLTALAVGSALGHGRAPARLRDVVPFPAPRRRTGGRYRLPEARGGPPGALAACVVAGLAVALLVGGPVGPLLGLVVALAGPVALGRLEPAAVRQEREALAEDLPRALDLLSACLTGGAPLGEAVRAVADAFPGPCGARLLRVASAIEVGCRPGDAWAALAVPGDELAGAAARALARAGEGGAPVVAAVVRLSEQAREVARARGERAAQRVGVLAVGPLGLCFLPAFVLVGVVPVVAGLVGPLLTPW